MPSRRQIRNSHDILEACQDLAIYINPYPPQNKYDREWWAGVCDQAGVTCEGEDLTIVGAMELYTFLMLQIGEILEDMNRIAEKKVRNA